MAWIGLMQIGPWIGYPSFSINFWVALIIVPLNEVAKELGQASGVNGLNLLIYGVLLLAVVLGAPDGCWPWLARRLGLSDRGS